MKFKLAAPLNIIAALLSLRYYRRTIIAASLNPSGKRRQHAQSQLNIN